VSARSAELIQLTAAIWKARAIYAMACLGIADLLVDRPCSAAELARATGTHLPSLHRLLRALASFGALTEIQPSHFAITELGAALRRDDDSAARAVVLTIGGDWQWQAWQHFRRSLETGEPGLAAATGQRLFDYLACHPDEGDLFNEAMVGMYRGVWPAIVEVCDFAPFQSVADVGGGTGLLLAEILATHPHLSGALYELPATVPQAQHLIDARGLSERCMIMAADFFSEVPSGHDAYVLAHVLHDWDDAHALSILRNCRKAVASGGRLFIVEIILPPGDMPHRGKLLDLVMLTVTGGKERTEDEFSALLAASDFRLDRVVQTAVEQNVIEATAV
jgi:SAM-dependent methyltransferase